MAKNYFEGKCWNSYVINKSDVFFGKGETKNNITQFYYEFL